MRYFYAALVLVALIAAGCKEDGDVFNTTNQYFYPPEDTVGYHGSGSPFVHVLSPRWGATLEMYYDWQRLPANYNTDCPWAYWIDTVFTARVAVNLPGGARTARIYTKSSYSEDFSPWGGVIHPMTDTFDIAIYNMTNAYGTNLPTDSNNVTFFVQGLAADSSNWISETVSVWISPRTALQMQPPTLPPVIDTIYQNTYGSDIQLRWCNQSPLVSYALVSRLADGQTVPIVDSIPGGYAYFGTNLMYPSTHYTFQVIVGNALGRSPVSNTYDLLTRPLLPPTNLRVFSATPGEANLQWSNPFRLCDSILVARRDETVSWSTLASLPVSMNTYPQSYYTDTAAVSQHVYFYRVGAAVRNDILWGVDSVGVWVQ